MKAAAVYVHLFIGAVLLAGPAHAQTVVPPEMWNTCAACHAPQAGPAVGPPLAGVVGRRAGSVPGFSYSRAMKTSGLTWDEGTLAAFIADPQQVVPGNRMPFAGLPDAAEAAGLVKYLKTIP